MRGGSILVLNGPNLGRLGTREPAIYGRATYVDLVELCQRTAAELGYAVSVRQTDAEHEMLSWLHEAADAGVPVVINPAAWTHYSVAIADACAMLTAPFVEVHLSNVHAREEFRRTSLTAKHASGVIAGFGIAGYALALRALVTEQER